MLAVSLIGAVLVFCGVLYMARATINRGRMSDPHVNPGDTADISLEPRRQGLGFLGKKPNRAGLILITIGGLLLLVPLLMDTPQP